MKLKILVELITDKNDEFNYSSIERNLNMVFYDDHDFGFNVEVLFRDTDNKKLNPLERRGFGGGSKEAIIESFSINKLHLMEL